MRNRTTSSISLGKLLFLLIAFFSIHSLRAQDSVLVSAKYLQTISAESKSLEQKLDKKSQKLLKRLQKQEAKMQAKLSKVDSSAAKKIFADSKQKYDQLQNKVSNAGNYIPKLDSLATSLKFLESNPQFLSQAKEAKEKLQDAMAKMDGLKQQLAKAENIKQFIRERKQYLKEQLSKFGFAKELKKLNREVYYYAQQVNEYKAILKDSKKAERKALELLSKTKLFKDFMKRNSELARLFPVPVGAGGAGGVQSGFAGLQTRIQFTGFLQQNGMNPSAMASQLQRSIQDVQDQAGSLQSLTSRLGLANKGDLGMPDFKPNSQKTKSFWKRLEWGTNIQSQKAKLYFPATTDIAFSVGYKLNDKSVIGIGGSYKAGLGESWQKIEITHQGIGLRSFIDWKIKGDFCITGGYEQNYRAVFNDLDDLRNLNGWQQSGLIGVTKNVTIKSKMFRKMKFQLLWDFLSYKQRPVTEPLLFRVGYNF